MRVKELHVWFEDDSRIIATGDYANNANIDLQRYSQNERPRFIELVEGSFYASATVASFAVIKED